MTLPASDLEIAIVGPCASGKSTLARRLGEHGLRAHQIVQEHSYVPDMWQVIGRPDLLIFLDASYGTCSQRKALNWREADYREQQRRLAHARRHCHIYIPTDSMQPDQVVEAALGQIRRLASGDDIR